MTADPARIVDGLYLGSRLSAGKRDVLADHGITHVVNTAREVPCYFIEDPQLVYLELELEDSEDDDMYGQFKPTASWIHAAIDNKGVVLVHCQAGISRSASIIMAYLMLHRSMSLREAFLQTKACKNNVQPNVYFFRALQRLDRELGTPEKDAFSLSEFYLDVLVSMGFDSEKAEKQLRLADGDFDIALGGCLM
ncbi:putative tyrosine phosphatase 123R [Diplonema papillatum]|nr:putative tyrosine phosphatase 123R [Diplonema papillatum]|eukprot:gene1297-2007_t